MTLCIICGGTSEQRKLVLFKSSCRKSDYHTQWISKIKNACSHVKFGKRFLICQSHFEHEAFVNKTAYDMGFTRRLYLKQDAVPVDIENCQHTQSGTRNFVLEHVS